MKILCALCQGDLIRDLILGALSSECYRPSALSDEDQAPARAHQHVPDIIAVTG